MPEPPRPRAKRVAAAARGVPGGDPPLAKQVGFRVPRPVPVPVPVPVAADDDGAAAVAETNYALRLTEALDAISGAAHADPALPRPSADGRGPRPVSFLSRLAKSLQNLPPIRLPIGPPIPWRVGLPALVGLMALTVFFARPAIRADSQVARLPAAETYPVQQEAPLFANPEPTQVVAIAAPPLGVSDAAGVGFDVLDVGLKLVAVLALAYGSLMLLKRAGMGGGASTKIAGRAVGMQVVASLTLAPNRTVHLLKVPGGRSILVGATPNQVNLIADLGELPEDTDAEAAGSFFDILKHKISP